MSNGLNKLFEIGIDKIHEQTHITKKHIETVLNEDFENMSKVQFLGFISIFQREYGVKLDDLKQKGLEFYNQTTTTISEDSNIFASKEKKQNINFIYLSVGAILILIIFAILVFNSIDSSSEVEIKALDNTTIKTAQNNIERYKHKITSSKEENTTKKTKTVLKSEVNGVETKKIVEETKESTEVIETPKVFKIDPKRKVWIGYIDLSNHKRYQKTLRKELDLNASKDWLLVLGNSNVKFDVNGEKLKFKTKYNLRLLYKNSKLTKISVDEFKRFNGGKKW